jgi:hypothetical protein
MTDRPPFDPKALDRTQRDDGGSVYPGPMECGMSLRDYFAAAALTGIMGDSGMRPSSLTEFAHMATRMYQVADAMIAERSKP